MEGSSGGDVLHIKYYFLTSLENVYSAAMSAQTAEILEHAE
jgi:hypothetical protein